MPLSNSVLRRYTPPTCTLEIVAKNSPLSRWVGKSALKDLRFELRFDDPRKPEDQRITIRGDRTDLDVLYEAVNSYVQDFVSQSSVQLPMMLQPPAASAPDSTVNTNKEARRVSYLGSDVNPSDPLPAQTFEEELDKSNDSSPELSLESNPRLSTLKPQNVATQIYLQPRGLLSHDLVLGGLASEEAGRVVNLSVLQLFDLATALDEYATEVVALPNLKSPLGWTKTLPAWTPTAAAVLVTVGVTTAVVKLLDRPNTMQQTASTAGRSPIPGQTPLLSQVPVAPASPILISPLPTPILPPGIASSPTLTPPPPVTVPPPGSFTPPTRERPTITINPSNPAPPLIADAPQRSIPALVPGGVASAPGSSANSKSPSSSKTTASGSSSGNPSAQQSQPGTPSAVPTLPSLPNLPPIPATAPPADVAQQAPSSDTRTASASRESNQSESASSGNAANSKLSDTIPQVAEARTYFEQRWKPPSNLTQTVEYSLSLNADGSIQRILPLGKAAGDYIDRTGIPLPGEPFVSPIQGTGNPIIRVVLGPDGKVQTFLEK
ncbi:MAG TPA: DUF4335 domain-containing protein [Coleofasciculaceae cyanobacterium]|jgi:hypothetical protein